MGILEIIESSANKTSDKVDETKKSIKDFLENEYISFASYDNVRKIASYFDGMKLSQRKVLYTFLEKNISKEVKVARVVSNIADFTNYIHGEKSLEGVLVNTAQNFIGSNNINLLHPEGSFGTRFIPAPAASRYIYTHLSEYAKKVFRSEDTPVLEENHFEGEKVEYKYYMPILPLILVNGSEGISLGFSQKILPRKPKMIIEVLQNYIKNKNLPDEIVPGYNGFKGTIAGETSKRSFSVFGKFEVEKNKIIISEVPIGYTLKGYIKELDKLQDKKIIQSYKDLSDKDEFKFEIRSKKLTDWYELGEEDKIFKELKLVKKVTENFTCIDEHNKIVEFQNEIELLEAFIGKRVEIYHKRKEYQLNKYQEEIDFLSDRIKFIQNIIDGVIVINKNKKENILKKCDELGIKFAEKHLQMNLLNLTEEKINELSSQKVKLQSQYNDLKNKDIFDIWNGELEELKNILPN